MVSNKRAEDAKPVTLVDLLGTLAQTGSSMIQSLEATLNTEGLGGGPSLLELSHPSNSLFVHLRTDAVAAIRNSAERLNVELGLRHVRRISIWELVEGGNTTLTNRFADFTGHVLVQARSSTGVTAMYVSQQSIMTNAAQANVALIKLADYATEYARSVPPPKPIPTVLTPSPVMDVETARNEYMDAASKVKETAVCAVLQRKRGYGSISQETGRAYSLRVNGKRVPLYGHVSESRFGRYGM